MYRKMFCQSYVIILIPKNVGCNRKFNPYANHKQSIWLIRLYRYLKTKIFIIITISQTSLLSLSSFMVLLKL